MKRMICLILPVFLLLPLLAGCSSETPPQKPVDFYYPVEAIYTENYSEGADGHSSPVIRSEAAESLGHENDYAYLLNLYFRGPRDHSLHNPFPKNLTVVDLRLSGPTFVVTVSREFADLMGIDLTIAASCIAKTVQGLTGLNTTQLEAQGATLDGSSQITISCDRLLEQDTVPETTASNEP